MKLLKKSLAVLLAMVLTLGAFSCLKAEAGEITIKTPKIKSVKLSKDGTGIIITINKINKDVEGYEVCLSCEGVYDNSLYQNETEVFSKELNLSFENQKFTTELEPGTTEEKVIHKFGRFKSIPSGKYTIKVRSYNKKKDGTTRYSEYSKKTLKVSITETTGEGYKTKYDFSKVSKGDTITFGAYEQDANIKNGQEPIEWVVLSKTKSQLFVVSKYALDVVPYNFEYKDVTWETCSLRKWLNEKFYNAAFNKDEKNLIKTTTVENFDNPENKTPGGNDTKDKVFLLSMLDMIESDYGFSEKYGTYDQNRRCAPTAYAIARNPVINPAIARNMGYNSSYETKDGEAACAWWLRSPGIIAASAASVDGSGEVDTFGGSFYVDYFGVRPALYINLK